jgi:hypothetical protein
MNFSNILYLNIFSAGLSFIIPESFFQLSLLFVSIILTIIKCVEMIINVRIRKAELKKLLLNTPEKPEEDTELTPGA